MMILMASRLRGRWIDWVRPDSSHHCRKSGISAILEVPNAWICSSSACM
ncbi:MAG: hypothetical protein ACLUEV_00945 [Alistipes sp.]